MFAFDEDAFAVTALGDGIPPALQRVAAAVADQRVVFFTGAGTSIPGPCRLPSGPRLAGLVVEWLTANGMADVLGEVNDKSDLGEVAQAVEDRLGRPTLLRRVIDLVDWETSPFNLCHFALALLYAEGLLQRSFTANWDTKVRDASQLIAGPKLYCPCNKNTLNMAGVPLFVHVHGDINDTTTLVVTKQDLADPRSVDWTEPQLKGALVESEVVFIGFGADPDYVLETIKKVSAVMERRPLAVISDKPVERFVVDAARFAVATGLNVDTAPYVQADACEALTHVLRSHYQAKARLLIERANLRARETSRGHIQVTAQAEAWLVQFLLGRPLEHFLRFLRESASLASPLGDERQPPLTTREDDVANLLAAVLLILSCSDVVNVSDEPPGLLVELDSGERLQICPVLPVEQMHTATAFENVTRGIVNLSRSDVAKVPLVLICERTRGTLSVSGHPSLIAAPSAERFVPEGRTPRHATNLDRLDDRLLAWDADEAPRFTDLVELKTEQHG